jgi:hypothetical protein
LGLVLNQITNTFAKVTTSTPGKLQRTDELSTFFLNRLHEALFDYSADSFKAQSLNTHLRVLELGLISGQNEQHEHLTASVESFFDELEASITADPVLKSSKKELTKKLVSRAKSGWKTPALLLPAISALELQFNDYLQTLKDALLCESRKQKWSKKDLLSIVDALIVQYEISGFPRTYLYFVTQSMTHLRRLGRLNLGPSHTIDTFFKMVEIDAKEFSVYGYVSKQFEKMLAMNDSWTVPKPEDIPSTVKSKAKTLSIEAFLTENPILVKMTVASTCPHAAVDQFFHTTDRYAEQAQFFDHHCKLETSSTVLCCYESSGKESLLTLHRQRSPLQYVDKIKVDDFDFGLKLLQYFFTESTLSDNAKSRLLRAFEYHGAAVNSKRNEDQLLNLWSCLEGFVGVPASAGSKISFVKEAVLSCLTLLYPQRLFSLLANRIINTISQNEFDSVCAGLDASVVDNREKLALILLNPLHEINRKNLLEKIGAKDSLLAFRLFELFERFKDAKTTKNSLEKHRSKVEWQLNRIYWNRNLIVHSSNSLPYLRILVEHLHIYIDSFLSAILFVVASQRASSIPSVLELLRVHEEMRFSSLRLLSDSPSTDSSHYLDYCFGTENILKKLSGL